MQESYVTKSKILVRILQSQLSSIITRNDDENGFKVFVVNNLLRQLCEKNSYGFLTHDNVDKRCLNRSGLHLNKYGDSKFAKKYYRIDKGFLV